jgi:hypothetical protein
MNSVAVNSYDIPIIPSGKYAGQPATVLFDDISQMEWLKSQPWFDKSPKWKPVYNLIVHQSLVQPGSDSKTPEHNKLQNMFYDPNVQRRYIERIFSTHLNKIKDSINKLIQDPEFIQCFGIHDENTVDDLLAKSFIKIRVESEAKINWDVVIRFDACGMSFYSLKEIEEKCKKTYLKINNLENYEEEQRILYDAEKTVYEQKIVESNNYLKKLDLESCFSQHKQIYNRNICDFKNKYINYRKKYYNDLMSKYFKSGYEIDYCSSDGTYDISLNIFTCDHIIYCELKPSLGDDYPCVLRKMKSQIELTKKGDAGFGDKLHFMLILGRYYAVYTDIELLKKKFETITIVFTDELLGVLQKAPTIENTDNSASIVVKEANSDISMLLTEVSLLKSQLADAQEIISKTQQENDALKEQIAKLQKSTTKKPAQKDVKSITEYFKK